jgi:hypothetical protein
MTKHQIEHYIKIHKEHEARRTSTNERNKYWKQYTENSKSEI